MKILLVEDSVTLRYTMAGFIKQAGHESVVAESGEEALQVVETAAVDLVIMDVEMPGLDGFETTHLIREFFGERWVPIVFVTGMADEASYQKGIDAGGDDYMIKPVTPTILNAKLRAFERIVDMQHQLQKLNEELQTLSQRDGLTELFNRRAFEEKAERQWQISTRAHEPVAILMLDVDHFKEFNDHYGHQAGDDCLKRVASALTRALRRPADILARYGGEEFIVLLPGTNLQGTQVVAETLRKAVQSIAIAHAYSSAAEVITVSVGGAVAEHTTGLTPLELGKEADNALYRAKARGRNCSELRQIPPHKTVLIVDEDRESLETTMGLLRKHYNIITAHSSTECLEIAHNCHPDVIVLNPLAADVDARSVCENLQSRDHTATIPVLVIGERGGKRPSPAEGSTVKRVEESGLLAEVERYLA
ncbi:MAG: diguanylate cyclase [Cellvibrionaceae bacterium]